MAEGRMLKRNVSGSRRLTDLKTDSARLLWTWTLPYLDKEGRYHASTDMIKGNIVPRLKHFTEEKIEEYLQDMAAVGLIILYHVDGERYLEFRKFDAFQTIRKDKEGKPRPSPSDGQVQEHAGTTAGVVQEPVELRANSRPTHGEVPPNLKEVNLREANREQVPPVDNSKEKEPSNFIKNLGRVMREIQEKYPDAFFQQKTVLFIQNHKNDSNQDAIIHCLEQMIKCKDHIVNPTAYLEKIIAVENGNYNEQEHTKQAEEMKGTPEGDKKALESLGSIIKNMDIPIVKTEKVNKPPPPELPKEKCSKCGELFIHELMENGACCFCRQLSTIKCPKCTRTVGASLINRTTGLCIHCGKLNG
jgi:hypothetical protein